MHPVRLALPCVLTLVLLAGCSGSGDTTDVASEATSADPPTVASMCAEDEPDCDDMLEPSGDPARDGDLAAGTCLEGATECADNPTGGPPPPEEGLLVEPRDDLVGVTPTPWEAVAPTDDAQTVLAVSWTGGNQDCFGLDRVDVVETDEAVTLTVHTGQVAEDVACTMEAVYTTAEVTLSEPLGPRSILDGAS